MNLSSIDSSFTNFLSKYGKQYFNKMEYEVRRAVFEASLEEITAHNNV